MHIRSYETIYIMLIVPCKLFAEKCLLPLRVYGFYLLFERSVTVQCAILCFHSCENLFSPLFASIFIFVFASAFRVCVLQAMRISNKSFVRNALFRCKKRCDENVYVRNEYTQHTHTLARQTLCFISCMHDFSHSMSSLFLYFFLSFSFHHSFRLTAIDFKSELLKVPH